MNKTSTYSKTKRITVLSLLIALACVISLFDKYISKFVINAIPMIGALAPGFKLGLANIVILYIIYNFKFVDSLIAVLLKSVVGGFIYGGLVNFFIGFLGTMLSFFAMYFLVQALRKPINLMFISVVGGITHTIGQLLAVLIIYQVKDILLYSPYLILFSIISGLIVGIIVMIIQKTLNPTNKKVEKAK